MARVRIVARIRPEQADHARFVTGSLVGHLLIVVAVAVWPSLRGQREIVDAPLFVELVAPAIPTAPPTPPSGGSAPPPDTSDAARVDVPPPEPPPDVVQLPPPKSRPKDPPPDPRPQPPPVRPAPPEPRSGPQREGPGPAPGEVHSSASIAALEVSSGDVELGWYRSSVIALLHSHWRKPILDGIREAREVRVTFEIMRDGSVAGLAVESSSGVRSLDRSALRAVGDAAPFPPLPPNWSEPSLSAGFVFRLYPE